MAYQLFNVDKKHVIGSVYTTIQPCRSTVRLLPCIEQRTHLPHVTLKIVTLNSRFLFSEVSYKSKKSAVVRMSFVHSVSVFSLFAQPVTFWPHVEKY